jgi:hypothetical protein
VENLLKSYIKMIIEGEEVRIPTQLLSPDQDDNEQQMDNRHRDDRSREYGRSNKGEENDEVKEFCAAGGGAIAGMTGPITGHFTGVPSVKKRRKKKKAHK